MDKDLIDWCNAYPNIEQCSIQTFCDDNKEDKSDSRIMKMSRENLEWCIELQKRKHYWVFFSVNPMNEWRRSKDDVKFIQTRICDIDEGSKESQVELIEKAPITPSLVVESVHGFHLYYLATKNLTNEEYVDGNMWLMNYYHWDIKVVKDTARVLRLPWFLHQKWEPTKIKYRDDLSCWKHYTPDEMLVSFPFQKEEVKPTQVIKPIERKRKGTEKYWEKVNALDNQQMLYELSGTRFVNYQVIDFRPCSTGDQIYCDGKSTSCRLDKARMIWSSDKWWPTRIQRIEWYCRNSWTTLDRWDLAKRLNANHPELEWERKKKFDITAIEQVEHVWDLKGYVYPSDVFDEFECFTEWELVTIVAESNSWKTTFAMDLIKKNADLWRKWLYINLEFNAENVWKDKWLWYNGKTKKNMTDLAPMTEYEKKAMREFITVNMKKFDSISRPNGIDLSDLEQIIYDKSKEGYELFIVDSFSRIHGNLDWLNARGNQNKCMEELQELVQKLNIAIVMLHHTNKNWAFEGTQKIMDLSNVFIMIQKATDEYGDEYRKYILSKDKFVHNKTVDAVYKGWLYEKFYS